jgi:DNA-binding XRE family transcriptional regulator
LSVRPSDFAAASRTRVALRAGSARLTRIEAGASAADVARVVGVARTTVRDWELGIKVPTLEHALAYGRALAALAPKAA